MPTVALVGYTNAGKTTLFNRLAGEQAVVSDALFVTLDPLVRRVRLADRRELLVSDTVGFIDRLPHTLVAAFRATLEEVVSADLLLHVIDAGIAGRRAPRGGRAGARWRRSAPATSLSMDVYNKCDLLDPGEVRAPPASRAGRALHLRRDGPRPRRADRCDHGPAGARRPSHRREARPVARRRPRSGSRRSTGSAAWTSTPSTAARSGSKPTFRAGCGSRLQRGGPDEDE